MFGPRAVSYLPERSMPIEPVSFSLALVGVVIASITAAYVARLSYRVRFSWDCAEQGHAFEPRYSEQQHGPEVLEMARVALYHAERVELLATKLRVYECDVCRYCGKRTEA